MGPQYESFRTMHGMSKLAAQVDKRWQYLGLVRVYTKPRGKKPDFGDPLILTAARHDCRGGVQESASHTCSGLRLCDCVGNFCEAYATAGGTCACVARRGRDPDRQKDEGQVREQRSIQPEARAGQPISQPNKESKKAIEVLRQRRGVKLMLHHTE